jgi:Ca-activated chloride channel family protein
VVQTEEKEIKLDYSKLPVNVFGSDRITVSFEGAALLPIPEPEPESPYGMITILVVAIVGLIGIGIAIWKHTHKKPVVVEEKPEPSKYSYTGKLNIYITRTASGYDVPPLTFNLFPLPSGKVISLDEIFENCQVKEMFTGSNQIYFKAGGNRSLILTNNSDCTILKSREILMKRKSYELFAEAKADITFEDEVSECTIQYKDLRPSERC